ncbi:lysophospholipid acyltransferase family protein [Phytohabitans sp. ZYX-F-186]|uniref:Lysophospholipid acyltransferase family protein n=1 Tax=Phytohabitans maris TaxID=3071409 RepID=A0ABU0ZQ20_9ACTN|nr:lysophospholipid acyltransferase family protein [Phytohabitans sp. ZYX-F-186]MDQ7909136.1 lysophospholipid acyltransferase family protein [Phytohabitans sp. ZYX-F-186]
MAVKRLGPLRRFVVILVKSVLTPMTKRTWTGQEHIPPTGGVILAPNHLSHADPLVMAHFVYDAHRWPRFLGKASVFKVPVIGKLILRVQQIPVERGSVDAAKSLEALTAAIKDGGAVIIYPEGTTTREPDLWPMRGKTGAARLALATGAPVIPIAQWGAQGFYDTRTKKVRFRPRTPITIAAGPPVDLSRWAGAEPTRATLDEMTDEIMLRVRDLLAGVRGETPPPLFAPAKGEKP